MSLSLSGNDNYCLPFPNPASDLLQFVHLVGCFILAIVKLFLGLDQCAFTAVGVSCLAIYGPEEIKICDNAIIDLTILQKPPISDINGFPIFGTNDKSILVTSEGGYAGKKGGRKGKGRKIKCSKKFPCTFERDVKRGFENPTFTKPVVYDICPFFTTNSLTTSLTCENCQFVTKVTGSKVLARGNIVALSNFDNEDLTLTSTLEVNGGLGQKGVKRNLQPSPEETNETIVNLAGGNDLVVEGMFGVMMNDYVCNGFKVLDLNDTTSSSILSVKDIINRLFSNEVAQLEFGMSPAQVFDMLADLFPTNGSGDIAIESLFALCDK